MSLITETYLEGLDAYNGGEGQPGPELVPGGSCGVYSWIEGASGNGRRFLGLRHKTKEADGG